MGDGAHLVGDSYGGLGVLFAAARRPEATLSLALLEPGAFALGHKTPSRFWADAWSTGGAPHVGPARTFPTTLGHRFLKAVGSDPDEFPPELLAAALPLVPVCRRGRPVFDPDLPLDELAVAPFPKLVVSGGHHRGFDAMCHDLARRIGGTSGVVEGAGHEIQFVGEPLNARLLDLWGR